MSSPFTVRPLEPEDAPEVHALCARPDVARWTDGLPTDPPEAWRTRLDGADPSRLQRVGAYEGARLRALVEVHLGARPRLRHASRLWLALDPTDRGRDAAAALLEAIVDGIDRWYDQVRVEVEVQADHEAAVALLRGAGFEPEARLRGELVRDGGRVDCLLLARLRPGWSQPEGALGPPPPWPRGAPLPDAEVAIRPLTAADAPGMAAVLREPSVMWGTMQFPFGNDARWRRILAANDPERHHALLAEVGGRMVGSAGVHLRTEARRRHVAEIGMSVHPDVQGRGVGERLLRAALDVAEGWLGATRVALEVYADNTRARRLYEKHGFEVEGTRRYAVWRDGGYVDAVLMARVR